MGFQSLSATQVLFFCTSGLFFLLSVVLFLKKKNRLSLFLLFLGSLMLGFFMGLLDNYVNMWDEQFHMLVAKNMLVDPFSPMLIKNTEVGYSYKMWVGNHIWLHKQPLFLWQMALSMKIFGVSPLAGRLPSILMHALMVPMVYRMGKNMTGSSRIGYYAAFLFTVSYYVLDMVSGYRSTEHNDMAFLFYVSASMWAWTEYTLKRTWKWSVLIGLFAGAAVLNKWLPGLLVFGGWGLSVLLCKTDRNQLKSYLHLLLAFAVSVLMFLPWQIYTFVKFPDEARFEYDFNVLHFKNPIEDHAGGWKYYFDNLGVLYGEGALVPWLLLLGFILLLFSFRDTRYRIFAFVSVVGVYVFYTLAATKMLSFPIIVCVFAFLSFAVIFDRLQHVLDKITARPKIVGATMVLLLVLFGWMSFNAKSIEEIHFTDQIYRPQKENELRLYDYLITQQPDTAYTFFNLPVFSNVPFMFHKNIHVAYCFCPNQDQFVDLKKRGVKFAVVDNKENNIPSYILEDSTVQIIKNPYR
jgi:4-amino-4-deoxy-L-arabinose transferase-like glycosyltransferase